MYSSATQTLMGALISLLLVTVLILWARGTKPLQLLYVTVFGCYLLGVVVVAFLPLPEPGMQALAGWPTTRANLVVQAPWNTWSHDPQVFKNILMTVPFGFLLPLVTGWGTGRVIFAALSFTLLIETLQLTISTALNTFYRAFDVNDLVDNTIGGLLGLLCFGLMIAVSRPSHYVGEWPDHGDSAAHAEAKSTASASFITWGDASARQCENSFRK
jgi:glycopeptide antibiotics resistance protein